MKLTAVTCRRLAIIGGIFAAFSIVGFLVVPPIARSQIEKRLSAQLGRRVTVEKVRVNPYALSIALDNFVICEPDGATPFLGWRRLYARFDALASLRGEWVLGEVALDGFNLRVRLNADQSLNFQDILAKLTPPGAPRAVRPAQPGRPLRIDRLEVANASIAFSDLSRRRPFATTVGPLAFVLTDFHTAGRHDAPYHFEAVTESAEKFAWSGTLQAEPLRSSGSFTLDDIALGKYAPYYADRMRAVLAAGTLSVGGRYELSLAEDGRVMQWRDGAVKLRGLKLLESEDQAAAVELPDVDVTGIQADALAQRVKIGAVTLAGGHVRLRREKDGAINLLTMLQPPRLPPAPGTGMPPPAGPTAGGSKPPDLTVGELALKDFAVDVTDLAAPRPARLALSNLQFSLKDVTLATGASMPLQLAFAWAPHGTVRIDGKIGIAPVTADLHIGVAGLAILPLSPYLEQFVDARITQGALTATLAVQAALPEAKPVAAAVTGDVQVDKFGLVDKAHNEELAGFDALSFRGLRAGTVPAPSLALDQITIAGPYARIAVNPDRSVNLAAIFRPRPPAMTPAVIAPPPVAAPTPKIEIGRVTVTDGDYRFTDRSIEPGVAMQIAHFGGTISGLSSTNPAKADVDLHATVDGSGPVSITGKFDALGVKKSIDLAVALKNVDLLPLSPYSGEFAGYELAHGKLFVDVKLKLDDRKISSANVITLNQFTFGASVKSPEATHLPVRLGVALLKDTDGRIVIDVPVQGSVDDPNFKIGRVVLRVVVNLLTKAAISPFSLVGSMFGGGGDELAYQEFAPGSSALQAAEIRKLQTMTRALANRPGLSLDLSGSYDAAADTYALRRTKLADHVRRAIWEARRASDPNIAPPDQLAITSGENAAMIKQLFDAKFPPGTKFGTPLPAPPAVVAPPPPPPGFFKRIVAAVTFRAVRERRAARRENERHVAVYQQAVAAARVAGLPLNEMAGRLAEVESVTDDDLRGLAAARAQQVRDYFVGTGHIAIDRLFLSQGTDGAGANQGPRVFLSLQ